MLKLKNVKNNSFTHNKILWLEENESYSDATKQVYLDFIILYAHPLEIFKNKDLCNFTPSEIIDLFKNLPKIKERNSSMLWSAINSYLSWSASRGLCPQGNPCDGLSFNDIMKDNINVEAIKETYIKLDWFWNKIKEYNINFKISYQSLIILILYRYGVSSKYLRYLKWKDIDKEDMCISVWNETREDIVCILPIDDRFLEALDELDKEVNNKYLNNYEDELFNRDNYLVSKIQKKDTEIITNEPINQSSMYTRYNMIFKTTQEIRMNINNLLNSRKYDILFEMLKEKGELTNNDVSDVYKMFLGKNSYTGSINLKSDFEIIADIKIKN